MIHVEAQHLRSTPSLLETYPTDAVRNKFQAILAELLERYQKQKVPRFGRKVVIGKKLS